MGGTDRGDLGTLVMMTCALGCWIAAATSLGDDKMWLFVALGALLTVAGLALTRPAPPAGRLGTHRASSDSGLERM